MKQSFLVTLIILVCTVMMIGATNVAGQGIPGIPQQLLDIQNTLNSLKSEVIAIKNQLNTGVTVIPKRYYLTKDSVGYTGAQAPSACTTGFHMANLFEILTFSNLEYDTMLGATTDDSGFGPPSYHGGWIRTGQDKRNVPGAAAGYANCDAYTSADQSHVGTIVMFRRTWDFAPQTVVANDRIADWIHALNWDCSMTVQVWCVENH
jgi:hypothetical protein